jgi:hypothetical protein
MQKVTVCLSVDVPILVLKVWFPFLLIKRLAASTSMSRVNSASARTAVIRLFARKRYLARAEKLACED